MPAVSKAQQRFMGMVHAADKGETPASPEVAKVSASMKDSDAKDFASTKHKGLPDHVREMVKEIVRGVIRGEGAFGSVVGGAEDARNLTEMGPNDVHFKAIIKLYDKGGSFTKKKVGVAVSRNPRATRNQIIDDLKDMDYHEILDAQDELGINEALNEAGKLVFVVKADAVEHFLKRYPKVKQIMQTLVQKSSDIMKGYKAFLKFKDKQEDYLGGKAEQSTSQNFGTKTFYKYDWGNIKGGWPEVYQYLFTYHYGGIDGAKVEGINEIEYKDAVEKFNADLMKNSQVERIAKHHKRSVKDVVKALQPYLKVLRYSDKSIRVVSIDFRDTNSDVKVHASHTYQQNESIKEDSHDCGCNENHDCGCGGLHEHSHINEDIKNDVNKFLDKLNKEFPEQEYTTDFKGGKYARIVQQSRKYSGNRSAWGFISMEDNPSKGFKKGDLLKAAGFNAPAKGARGNILDGTARYGKWSPVYLK